MLNKVTLMGRLNKDPLLKYTPSNVAVASFTVAVDRRFQKQGEQRQTDFINIVVWRNTAEFVAKYFTKGQLIALSGNIQTRTWEDTDGKKHYVTEVVADEVYFAGAKKENTANEPADQQSNDFENMPSYNDDDLPWQ